MKIKRHQYRKNRVIDKRFSVAHACDAMSGQRSSPHRRFWECGQLFLLIVLVGCGSGNGGSNSSNATLTVSPAAVAIPTNGNTTLQATFNGSCLACFIATWVVTENTSPNCLWSQNEPPTGPCLGGTINENPPSGNSGEAIYYAPSTPGTYHVTAEGLTSDIGGHAINGTSVVTVTP